MWHWHQCSSQPQWHDPSRDAGTWIKPLQVLLLSSLVRDLNCIFNTFSFSVFKGNAKDFCFTFGYSYSELQLTTAKLKTVLELICYCKKQTENNSLIGLPCNINLSNSTWKTWPICLGKTWLNLFLNIEEKRVSA